MCLICPDTAKYLSELTKQKNSLVDILNDSGIETDENEKFNSLVLKVNEVCQRNSTAPEKLVQYYKFRDEVVNFELKKGHVYAFTVKDEDATSVYVVDTNGNTVTGVANKKMTGLKNGVIICAERCSGGGLTGKLSLLNLNAYVVDRWDWNDGSKKQYAPYYLKENGTTGVDIWEL